MLQPDNLAQRLTQPRPSAAEPPSFADCFVSWRSAHFTFTLEAQGPARLPVHKGGTLRGGFGLLLKQAVCRLAEPLKRDCRPCPHRAVCAYPYVFETLAADGGQQAVHVDEAPRPFVLQPPEDGQTHYARGDPLVFGLGLVGRAIDYLPFFVAVFERLGQVGLGADSGRFRLIEVHEQHPITGQRRALFQAGRRAIEPASLVITAADIVRWAGHLPPDRLRLRFDSLMRLKHQNKVVMQPHFHILFRRALRRVAALYSQHCAAYHWNPALSAWVAQAEQVRLTRVDVRPVSWGRTSTRQQRHMQLEGFIGEADYGGNLRDLLPVVALGSLIHVGQGATFGHGHYMLLGQSPALEKMQ